MLTISNNFLEIKAASKGAELRSIFHKQTNIEYLWSGDPAFWAKKSPVLFPIVGGLKENKFIFEGNEYCLNRHGFARDNDFEVSEQDNTSIIFLLRSDKGTKSVYPFDFLFYVKYSIENTKLTVTFTVKNIGNKPMFFSVGAHPAFAVPINPEDGFEDYYLKFSDNENAEIYPLSGDGLIESIPVRFLQNADILPLKKELFYKDALVFKSLKSNSISILNNKSVNGVQVSFDGFPYLGIWSAKDADFVCIEPWLGIADSVNASGKLADKEGINKLQAYKTFEASYSIEIF